MKIRLLNIYNAMWILNSMSFVYVVTEPKECFQFAPPPGGSNKDCRFDEFCACDFYELPVKKQFRNQNINVTFNHQTLNTTNIRAKKNLKTHCRVGEKGVCLHVCQLSILRPGSLFLREERLITAAEACKSSPHSQCIGYDKIRCRLDGISNASCFFHIPVCVCKENYFGVWAADEDLRKKERKCRKCDCLASGTRRCLKTPNNHCLCKEGYIGSKCNQVV